MNEHFNRHWQQPGALDIDLMLSSLGGGERRTSGYTGTKALMIAILEDGIRSYLSRVASVRSEAEVWINSRRRNFPFAFSVICDTLGLEPDAVAAALRRMREQNVSPRRAIRRSRPNVRRTARIRLRTRRKTSAATRKKPTVLPAFAVPDLPGVAPGSTAREGRVDLQ